MFFESSPKIINEVPNEFQYEMMQAIKGDQEEVAKAFIDAGITLRGYWTPHSEGCAVLT